MPEESKAKISLSKERDVFIQEEALEELESIIPSIEEINQSIQNKIDELKGL